MAIEVYLVGGAVRDELLSVEHDDRDFVVVGSNHQEMLDNGFKPIEAKSFPVYVKSGEEYALARKEMSTGDGYNDFVVDSDWSVTLEEDLSRRDLTINAIAKYSHGVYCDPFNGREDIDNRVLKHVSSAFVEDPVRILRVARFMSQLGDLNFTVHKSTMDLMKKMVADGMVNNLTPDRVWKETEKALNGPHPEKYFRTLQSIGALKVIIPELSALEGVPQTAKWHPEIDTFIHTLKSVRQAKILYSNPAITFATALHDLGKGITPEDEWPSHKGHEKAGEPLVMNVCKRLKVPNKYKSLALRVAKYHLKSHKAFEMTPKKVISLLNDVGAFKSGQEGNLEMFLAACHADATGRLGMENDPYPEKDYLMKVMEAIKQLDHSDIVEKFKGDGPQIGMQIHAARVKAVKDVRSDYFEIPIEHVFNP